jgi:hypothetical protein
VIIGSNDGSGESWDARGTYEIEVQDLMIPSTRYPNDFSFLYISHLRPFI